MNIQPNNQTVEKCLKQRTYYIDFYQREYVWKKEIVNILLEDIFFTFELAYEDHKDKDLTAEVLAKYNWYYLNIYITNTIGGKEYIVDGQQRLTTLTLIALKLLRLAILDKEYFENLIDTLKDCIYGKDKFKGNIFWIDNEKRKRIMQHLVENKDFTGEFESVTEENINERFKDISKYIDDKNLSKEKLKSFIMYFLERLVLVELKIEKDDTPMVFEVINDRGVALKPFEILKGKLVGALDKADTEKYSTLWEDSITRLSGIEDAFFIDYLKGKFIFKRNADLEKAINNQYHRYIFESNDIADSLQFRKKDKNHAKNIKDFIEDDLTYYSKLYSVIRRNEYEFLSYNNDINDLSGQYQNIIAACTIEDEKEQVKIESIAKEIDRLYMLLRLNGIYNSNNYQEISYQLNRDLQQKDISDYRNIFNNAIEQRIKEARNLTQITSLLDYDRFKTRGYDNIERRPLRYFFARVEKYICDNTEKTMENDVLYISTKTGHKTGYHIEHILSRNDENKQYFHSDEEFENQRNRLGGLLLLYNMDNIISNNEEYYLGKRKTYNNGLVWGRTLIDSFYHSTNSRFIEFNQRFKSQTNMEFVYTDKFDSEILEYRSKLLFEIVKKIWIVEN
ncbi:uncharacterized protein DUF262 [Mariniflexile fucanivorans]|uniref:Uncharacterized protein DUF262 n=1 Tax=Mariniflexile fucanivorans TaxID=264023 RepID=A0A4R1RG83_9FLAO|nr:DUF262 domain-containing protein [Mariniflexile fucanivorans]TCL64946.1 uncharacterized protein DUF262 [Mariniflexile fucanivorans]